jgi:hypothetical protein
MLPVIVESQNTSSTINMSDTSKQNSSHQPDPYSLGPIIATGTRGNRKPEYYRFNPSTTNDEDPFPISGVYSKRCREWISGEGPNSKRSRPDIADAIESRAPPLHSEMKFTSLAMSLPFTSTENTNANLKPPYKLVAHKRKHRHAQAEEEEQDQTIASTTPYLQIPDPHCNTDMARSTDEVESPTRSRDARNEDGDMSPASSHTLGGSDRSSSTLAAAEEEDGLYEEIGGGAEEPEGGTGHEGSAENGGEGGSETSNHTVGRSEGSSRTVGRSEDGDGDMGGEEDDDGDEEMRGEEDEESDDEGDLFAQSYREGSGEGV